MTVFAVVAGLMVVGSLCVRDRELFGSVEGPKPPRQLQMGTGEDVLLFRWRRLDPDHRDIIWGVVEDCYVEYGDDALN